jgi:hypothetical protein
MNRLAVPALCLLLAACETTGGPPPPPLGASVQAVEPGRFRVIYRGRSRVSGAEVRDRALLEAARTALAGGYDWFEVVDRSTEYAPPTRPRFTLGLGTGSYGRGGGFGIGTSTSFGGEAASLATLEVIAGKGSKPDRLSAYDARAVVDSLGAQLR